VKLSTHLQLVPRSRKRRSIHPLPHSSSWRSAKLLKQGNNFNLTFFPSKKRQRERNYFIGPGSGLLYEGGNISCNIAQSEVIATEAHYSMFVRSFGGWN
jgi:hypothetical protein